MKSTKKAEITAVGIPIGNAPLPGLHKGEPSKETLSELKETTVEASATPTQNFERLNELLALCAGISVLAPEDAHAEVLLASEIAKFFGAARASLFVVDGPRQQLVQRAGKNLKDTKAFRYNWNNGIVGHCRKNGLPLRINQPINKHEFYDSKIDDRTGIHPSSTLFVPISNGNEIVAILQVMHLQKNFSQEDEDILCKMGKFLATVIANHRIVDTLKKECRREAQLLEACKAISADLDIGPLSTTIIEKTKNLLEADFCNLFLVDGATKELCAITPGKEEKRFPLHRGLVGLVGSTGEELVVSEVLKDARFDAEVDSYNAEKPSNILCMPIVNDNDDVLGVIEVINSSSGNVFDASDAETLRSLTEQILESLSNAELFHKTLTGFNAAISTQQKYQSLLEVAETLTSQLDEDNLITFIMKRARELVNAERCSLFLVDAGKEELRSKVAEGTEEIRFPMSSGIAGHVATTGETLNISNAYEDPRFNTDIDKQTGFQTKTILCMPIYNDQEEIIGVTQLINKKEGVFGQEDEEILRAFSIFCGITLRNARLYKQAIRSQHKTKALLDVAVALSSETNIQPLLRSIMKHARRLVKADRASLFILDPENQELRSQIADGTEEIRMPLQGGIVGYVASTGEEVAVDDAYKDPRFNPTIDQKSGYRTRSMLCIPIRNEKGDVIAVTQMINKRVGIFHEEDRQLLKAFASFAAKTISTVSIPITPQPSISTDIDTRYLPSKQDREEITSWSFDVWKYSPESLIRFLIAILEHFNLVKKFAMPMERLINFLTALSKTYRDVPYHNFYHAVDVVQTVFLFFFHAPRLHQEIFSDVELLAILVAAMCHDVDHGGMNNAFHVKAQTPLALLYKDTSVLETHHCSRSITLLSEVENDILSGMDDQQYSEMWKMMISAILATDMSLHFALLGQFEALVKEKNFDKTNIEHRKLLANMIMKCSDISNVVKPFPIAKHWAEILCAEFFMQGDMEKAKGLEVSPLMNRSTVVMPQMQLGFINSICVTIFSLFVSFVPELQIVMDTLKSNMNEWNRILQKGMSQTV